MRRRVFVELEINHDRWLVSYSDFVTLLFAFFVVMYSISQVNEGKYRVLSSTLMEAFSVPQSSISPIQVGDPTLASSPSVIDVAQPQESLESSQGAFDKQVDLPQLSNQFSEQFADLIEDDLLKVNSNELWLAVELKASILFPTGSAFPSLQAKGIFEEIAQMLAKFDNPIQVEGFTDNVPINNRRFSSNWELSSARSASIVKVLANNGVAPSRLSAVGYGEYQPISENNTTEGREKNRRVVLMISREKMQRPSVGTEQEIAIAIAPTEPQQSQPFPQPGLALPTTITEERDSSQDAADRLDRLLGDQSSDIESQGDELAPVIEPIKLEDGGLLFTSDPDLQRNN